MMEKMLTVEREIEREESRSYPQNGTQYYFGEGTVSTTKCVDEGLAIS